MTVNVDPNLFTIGPFVLSWHGLFSAVGLGAGIWSGVRLLLGQAIGRIGDVINGEHHGLHVPEGAPWAVTYVHPNPLGEPGVPNHLAVGYEMLWDLFIYGLLLGLWGRLPRPGMLFWL